MTARASVRLGVALALGAAGLAPAARAADGVAGVITRTYTIVEDTDLTGEVTCQVANGTPCFAFGAPGVQLRLNGYTITGKAEPVTGCGGTLTAGEHGISTAGLAGVSVHGPGLVQRFRFHGVAVMGSRDARVDGITASTNCAAGVFINALSFGTIVEGVVSVRNGSTSAGASCGGI